MAEPANYDQGVMAAGTELMEVTITGGDGGEMTEETLSQVVSMLQANGQLTGPNQTIIIRQPGSDEIQMIQPSSNGQEFAVSKLSEADLQALQSTAGALGSVDPNLLESGQGDVVMVDDGGNLVDAVGQLQDGTVANSGGVIQLPTDSTGVLHDGKLVNEAQAADILANFNDIQGLDPHNMINSVMKTTTESGVSPNKAIMISSSMNPVASKSKRSSIMTNGDVVSIKINTGFEPKPDYSIPNAIKISTVTGQHKYQAPKFHKCESCSINFVSKIAYMNHMENCPSTKRKLVTPLNSKSNITYTCVFCDNKFTSRLVLMQHVRACDKAKNSKNVLNSSSKLKVTTSESRLGDYVGKKITTGKNSRKPVMMTNKLKPQNKLKSYITRRKESYLDPDDPGYAKFEEDSFSEEEKNIPYDDDEDFNDEDLDDDEAFVDDNRKSQKHLGPIITKGMFQCRDCSRTFSKENQYNRHVKGCSNKPLSKINNFAGSQQMSSVVSVNAMDAAHAQYDGKRKRMNDLDTSNKKRALGGAKALKNKNVLIDFSDNETDEDIMEYLSDSVDMDVRGKGSSLNDNNSSTIRSSINKIVKISPSDKLVKQTGKAILSKMNQKSQRRINRDFPVCGLCGDKFTLSGDLGNHMKITHSDDLLNIRDILDGKGNCGSIKCPLCNLYFISTKLLIGHMVVIHNSELRMMQDELDSQNVNLSCPFCSESCFSQDLLKEHIATCHLDQLTNKPSDLTCPNPIDVLSLIKEKNNGSIISVNQLLSKQKTITCPDCGLLFSKLYFQHHKCASVNFSSSAKKFICSEAQCSSLSFYKLIHLLTHLKQTHGKMSMGHEETFETQSQFLEWLKKEENESKKKYTKAFQRMKQGKLLSVWICHRFHNAMRDHSANTLVLAEYTEKSDRLSQCYSRIYAETGFNKTSSRYDGETCIQYYSKHQHPAEKILEAPGSEIIPTKVTKPIAASSSKSVVEAKPQQMEIQSQQTAKLQKSDVDDLSVTESQALAVETPPQEAVADTKTSSVETPQSIDESSPIVAEPQESVSESSQSMTEAEQSVVGSPHPEAELIKSSEADTPKTVENLLEVVTNEPSKIVEAPQTVADPQSFEETTPMEVDSGHSDVEPPISQSIPSLQQETSFSDAAELRQLLEGDDDFDPTKKSLNSTFDEQQLSSFESLNPTAVASLPNVDDDKSVDAESPVKEVTPPQQVPTSESKREVDESHDANMLVTPKGPVTINHDESEKTPDPKEASNLIFNDTDLLLEKMLGERSAALTPAEELKEQSPEPELVEVPEECVTPEEDSSTASSNNVAGSGSGEEMQRPKEDETSKDSEEGEDESTYVLPADIEEWNKLFELVTTQVQSDSLTPVELVEAKKLLTFEKKILKEVIEKQVEIFNSLCSLANVQMT